MPNPGMSYAPGMRGTNAFEGRKQNMDCAPLFLPYAAPSERTMVTSEKQIIRDIGYDHELARVTATRNLDVLEMDINGTTFHAKGAHSLHEPEEVRSELIGSIKKAKNTRRPTGISHEQPEAMMDMTAVAVCKKLGINGNTLKEALAAMRSRPKWRWTDKTPYVLSTRSVWIGDLMLTWKPARITAVYKSKTISVGENTMMLKSLDIPETVRGAMVGMPVSQVVEDIFEGSKAEIRRANRIKGQKDDITNKVKSFYTELMIAHEPVEDERAFEILG